MSEWQPIETAPVGAVLLFFPAKFSGRMIWEESILVGWAGQFPNRPPSHWMPLPPAPKTARRL